MILPRGRKGGRGGWGGIRARTHLTIFADLSIIFAERVAFWFPGDITHTTGIHRLAFLSTKGGFSEGHHHHHLKPTTKALAEWSKYPAFLFRHSTFTTISNEKRNFLVLLHETISYCWRRATTTKKSDYCNMVTFNNEISRRRRVNASLELSHWPLSFPRVSWTVRWRHLKIFHHKTRNSYHTSGKDQIETWSPHLVSFFYNAHFKISRKIFNDMLHSTPGTVPVIAKTILPHKVTNEDHKSIKLPVYHLRLIWYSLK